MNDGPDTPEEDKPDPAILRRRQAMGAAGDLSRMGIDPRSLGLGGAEPSPEPSPERSNSGPSDQGGSVVPLRPEFHGGASPVQQADPAPPVAPQEPDPVIRPATDLAPAASPGWRPDTGRLLRTVLRGMTRPDAAEAMQDERALVDAVRHRQSDRRIVTFLSGKGGVGCTTVALATGTTLMALRDDDSVLVDVQQGTASLGELAGVGLPADVHALLAQNEVVEPPTAPSGLGLVDGSGWDEGLTRTDVSGVLERLGAEHTFNLLDAGNDPGEGAHTALARADQVVVVTGPGQVGAAALQTVMERLRRANPAVASRVVTVIVCQSEHAHRETLKEVAQVAGRDSIVVVPPDESLATGAPFDPARVSSEVREAFIRVAAGIAAR